MRTMDFDASGGSGPLKKKAGTLGAAALIHVLALLLIIQYGRSHFDVGRDQRGPPARFFVDVSLAPRTEPLRAATDSAAAAPAAAAEVANAPRRTLEVLTMPRAEPDQVRLQLPPSPAADARIDPPSPVADAAVATAPVAAPPLARPAPVAAPSALPAPPAATASLPGQRDDTPKVIAIETMGMSSTTYTFPALTGEAAGTPPHVFKVEIGAYPEIELAIVNHVIEQIRARYPNEITWDSRQKGGMVRLSMRIEDHETLVKFLRLELFGRRKSTSY